MGVLMREARTANNVASLFQRRNHSFIGIALFTLVGDDALAREARRFIGQEAISIDGCRNVGVDAAFTQSLLVRRPDNVVIRTMAGGGVDEARACVVSDVIAVEEWDDKIIAKGFERVIADPARSSGSISAIR